MAANKIKIMITGTEYTVITEEEPEYVLALASELDSKMADIMKGNSYLSVTQAAVLSALDYADECKKSTATADKLRDQIKDYLDDAGKATNKAAVARHETEKLRKEIEALKAENEKLKKMIK
ncbi:MAG: cell division protein ZapA [Acutalibacteraceae bacterium]